MTVQLERGAISTTTPPLQSTDKRQQRNSTTKRCFQDKNHSCNGKRTFSAKANKVTCTSCSPCGISFNELTASEQIKVLRGALYE